MAAFAAFTCRSAWAACCGWRSTVTSTSESRTSSRLRPRSFAVSAYSCGVTSFSAENVDFTSRKRGEAVHAKSITSACSKTWVDVPSAFSRRSVRFPVAPTTKRFGSVISTR